MGDIYHNGRGVPKDDGKATEWYRKAAAQGHTLSKKILNAMGAAEAIQNEESPFDMFRKDAEKGNPQSMYIVGRYYEDGIGMNKDVESARIWYGKAAAAGNEAAKRALAALDRKG